MAALYASSSIGSISGQLSGGLVGCLAMQLARSGGRRLAAEALAQSDGRVSHCFVTLCQLGYQFGQTKTHLMPCMHRGHMCCTAACILYGTRGGLRVLSCRSRKLQVARAVDYWSVPAHHSSSTTPEAL